MPTLSLAPSILFPTGFLGTSPALLFTASGQTGAIIKKGSFANISAGPVTLTLWRVPIGAGSSANGLTITPGVVVANGDIAYCPVELINMVLLNGDSIWGQSSVVNALTGTISGFTY